jgi:hypothetical protein
MWFRLIWHSSGKFSVFMEPLDLAKYRRIYSARQEEAAAAIDTMSNCDSDGFPDFCFRDHSGKYEHENRDCPFNSSAHLGNTVCPFEEWYTCNDQLRWLDTAKFISCYFRNPASAGSQRILHGFNGHRFVHDYRFVLSAGL